MNEESEIKNKIIGIRINKNIISENGLDNARYTDAKLPFGFKKDFDSNVLYFLGDLSISSDFNDRFDVNIDCLGLSIGYPLGALFGFTILQLDINNIRSNISMIELSTKYILFNIYKQQSYIYSLLYLKLRPISFSKKYDESLEYIPTIILGDEVVYRNNIFSTFIGINYYINPLNIDTSYLDFKVGVRLGILSTYITR